MTLLDIINEVKVPLPIDSKVIVIKMIATTNHLRLYMPKAIQDFDNAMKIFSQLYNKDGYILYKNEVEKAIIKTAFNSFWPRYKKAKKVGEKERNGFWTKEQ